MLTKFRADVYEGVSSSSSVSSRLAGNRRWRHSLAHSCCTITLLSEHSLLLNAPKVVTPGARKAAGRDAVTQSQEKVKSSHNFPHHESSFNRTTVAAADEKSNRINQIIL
jgi:hypothetical protein